MSRGGEPRSNRVGKCVTCGLVVRQGDEQYDNADEVNLFHRDCAEANRREIERWNADVRADRKAKP
jgi:hypothetical protein